MPLNKPVAIALPILLSKPVHADADTLQRAKGNGGLMAAISRAYPHLLIENDYFLNLFLSAAAPARPAPTRRNVDGSGAGMFGFGFGIIPPSSERTDLARDTAQYCD